MRLLVWNIQFFTINRVQDNTDNYHSVQSQYNRDHIVSTVLLADADVFIIIEPRSQQAADVNTVGELATGGGPDGLIYLYQQLNAQNNNWYLVPPLKTVNKDIHGTQYTEAVGIFYRGDRHAFTGPWVWPAASPNLGPSVPPGVNVNTANYPNPWAGMLPANTQFASQARFFNGNQEILFPNANDRRPVLTTFLQLNVANPKTYKIFACHTTPSANPDTATARMLGQITEGGPTVNEVVVFCGDFNVDGLSNQGVAFFRALPEVYFVDVVLGAGQGPTTTKPVAKATPPSYLKKKAYDNFLVRVRRNPQKYYYAPGYPATVVDRTAGSVQFPSDMVNKLNSYTGTGDSPLQIARFHQPNNYGHIGNFPGTSDHLAIFAII